MTDSENLNEIQTLWTRPAGPIKIWDTVDGKNSDGNPVKFIIQDIPQDRYEEAVNCMINHFIPDEALTSSLNMKDDPIALEDCKHLWRLVIEQGMTIGAFMENHNGDKTILAGVNMLTVESKNATIDFQSILKPKSQSFVKVLTFTLDICKEANIFVKYKVDHYLGGLGLVVKPEFRGHGLGARILRAREQICKEYAIQVTSTFFSSAISQKAAENAGFQVLLEKNYSQVLDDQGQMIFPGIKWKLAKVQAKRYS